MPWSNIIPFPGTLVPNPETLTIDEFDGVVWRPKLGPFPAQIFEKVAESFQGMPSSVEAAE